MGAFIAALRKAGGMTQQEVADRLNVSNKTISKWERDEGYPEITIIPALAELFDVTSDEILRGGRIPQQDRGSEKQAVRAEKQIRRIVSSSMARFQNFSYLAAALALVGFIILFTIAYTFYRPMLGFGIMMIFLIASVTLELYLINTARTFAGDHEIIADNEEILAPLQKTMGRYSFVLFIINAAVFVLSLPFILVRDSYYVDSVISLDTYLSWLPLLLIIIGLLGMLCLNIFQEKLGFEKKSWPGGYPAKRMRLLNLIQGGTLLLAAIPVIAGAVFLAPVSYPFIGVFSIMFLFAVVGMIVMVAKSRPGAGRLLLLAAGIRNILYFFALTYLTTWVGIVTTAEGESYHFFSFTPGPPLLFLGATAGYLMICRLLWKSCSIDPGEQKDNKKPLERKLKYIDEKIDKYLQKLDESDAIGDSVHEPDADEIKERLKGSFARVSMSQLA